MDDEHPSIEPFVVGVPGLPGADIGSPGDVLTYLGPNFVPKFRPVTGAGLGNLSGPATTTVDFVPQWSNTTGTLLKNGLPVSTTPGALTIVETDAGGKISAGVIPNSGVTAGTYTNANITVGLDGRLTAASSGAANGIADAVSDTFTYGRLNATWTRVVPLTGGTMTGLLILSGPPAVPLGAATKGYIDTLLTSYAPIDSPLFTGLPRAPNQAPGDDSTRLATTHFVHDAIVAAGGTVTLVGDVVGSGPAPTDTTVARLQGRALSAAGPLTSQVLTWSGTQWAPANLPVDPGGTVTSVGLAVPPASIFGVTGSPVTGIGTLGLTTNGTVGGVPYFSSGTVLSSSAALTAGQLVMGGATGPAPLGSIGTAVQTLHGGAAPAWGLVNLGTDVTANLPVGNLNSGAGASAATFWRGDGTWASAGGTVNPGTINQAAWYAASGTAVSGNPAVTMSAAGSITIQRNTGTLPTAVPGTGLWINFANSGDGQSAVLLDAYAGPASLILRQTGGVGTGRTATLDGDSLGEIRARGYDGAAYSASSAARITFQALETFTSTSQGTEIRFDTNPPGSNARVLQVRIGPGLAVGMPTPPIGGIQPGDGNFSRVLLNGVPIGDTIASGPITISGDATGFGTTTIPLTVTGLQGRAVASTAPLDTNVLAWSSSASQWQPAAAVTGGTGGTPGGASGSVQINASGSFGGIVMTGDATWSTSTTAFTLNTVNTTVGVFQGLTVNGKGLVTHAVDMAYAPLLSPAFLGVPSAPTAAPGTNSTQLATTAYVDTLYSPGAYLEASGGSTTLSDSVAVNLASVSLTAGDWIVNGSAYFNTATALNFNFLLGASTVAATLPGIPYYTQLSPDGALSGGEWTLAIPERKFSFSTPTTVYLVVRAGFGPGSTVTAQGHIAANQMQRLVAGTGGGPGGGMSALTGDVTGSGTGTVVTSVVGLRGRAISATPPTDTYVLAWNQGALQWQPTAPATGAGGGTVTSVAAGTGLTASPSPIISVGTISLTIPVAVTSGGTGATTAAGALSNLGGISGSGMLTSRLVIGAGGNAVGVLGSLGATNTVLHGNAGGPPSFGPVDLANDLTGNLPVARLNSGTLASSTTYWRGDATWATPPTGGTPGGVAGNVQYNSAGTTFGGSTGITLTGSVVTGLNVGGDATGDMYYRAAGGFTRLPIGTNGYTMQVVSGLPQWINAASGGGTVNAGTVGQVALYTGSSTVAGFTMSQDAVISATGAVTIQPLAITTGKIADAAVTYAKMQNVTATMLLGRGSAAGNGPPVEIIVGTNLTLVGTTLSAVGGSSGLTGMNAGQIPIAASATTITSSANLSGDVVSNATLSTTIQPLVVNTGKIADGAVTLTKMQSRAGLIVIGNPTGTAAVPSEITLTGTANVTRVASSTAAAKTSGNLATWNVDGNLVDGGAYTAGVTSVTLTSPGGIFAISGTNPITTTGTFGFTTTGTSGGIPFFNSASTLASSGSLQAWAIVLGGGTAIAPYTLPTGLGVAGAVLTSSGPAANPTWQPLSAGSGTVVSSALNTVPYYTAATSVTGNANVTMTAGGIVTLNQSGAGAPALTAGAVLQVAGAPNTGSAIQIDAFNGSPALVLRRSNSVAGAAVNSGDALGAITARGYDNATYSPSTANVLFSAAENWVDSTHHGSTVTIIATPLASGTQQPQAVFGPAGVTIGLPTAQASPAIGDLNCVRLFVNGVAGVPDSTGTTTGAGATQGTANPISTQFVNVTTVGAGTGVVLPTTPAAGSHVLVRNSGANTLLVYPASSGFINALAINTAIGVPVNSTAYFEAASTTQWFTVP